MSRSVPVHLHLTPAQQAAVEHADGPLLVLAGPGSGKTRVITQRIVRLTEVGVDPRRLLAITFTNKAAREMQTRVEEMRPELRVWISTFHRFCARLLRTRAEAVGLGANFTILDTTDQHQLVKQVMHDLDLDTVHYPPSRILSRISRAKNELQTAELFVRAFEESIGDHVQAVVARVFPEYQRRMLQFNAVDFDDLLLHVATILDENPELRSELDERFCYILVDEYQDTNRAQYRIVQALSHDFPNLCVTGDPDQSIYGWRGAKIDNILRFEADFPQAAVVRLEHNFRSTPNILRAADRLIAHNRLRKHKSLLTDNAEGPPVELLSFADGRHEADAIARDIGRLVDEGEFRYGDFAVFYRVNALSRELERALTRHRVPYQVAAGVEFFERAEIKDLLGYLRLIANPADESAFARVVNRPARKIGKKSLARLTGWARARGNHLVQAAAQAEQVPELTKSAVGAFQRFSRLLEEFAQAAGGPVQELLELVLERTGYADRWKESPLEEDQQRLANIGELLTAAVQYDRECEGKPDDAGLEGFLESTSLVSDVDRVDEQSGAVTLMTLHSAKGLEFPVVFILAVEQGLIPHERSLRHGDSRELEEERRLLFVGMTRAQRQLFLTQTAERDLRGRRQITIPSEFLSETEFELSDHTAEVTDSERPAETSSAASATPPRTTRSGSRNASADRPLLTTAADLLNGTATPVSVPQGFAVGMSVRHPVYGPGKVVAVSGFSKHRTVTVQFDEGSRSETFVAAKSPLQPVGVR